MCRNGVFIKIFSVLLFVLSFLFCFSVWSTPLDLSFFQGDPTADVSIDPRVGTIDLNESDWVTYAYDDTFQVPGDAIALTFVYNLITGANDLDWLVITVDTDSIIENSDILFSTSTPVISGIGSVDLTSFQGLTVALTFGLEYDDQYPFISSAAHLSNIKFVTAPIPEPETLFLLGAGLITGVGIARKSKKAS